MGAWKGQIRLLFTAQNESRRDQEGFTLLELLVAIIIISILAVAATQVWFHQRRKAWVADVRATTRHMAEVENHYLYGGAPAYTLELRDLKETGFRYSPGVVPEVAAADRESFCVEVYSNHDTSIVWHFSSATGYPVEGPASAASCGLNPLLFIAASDGSGGSTQSGSGTTVASAPAGTSTNTAGGSSGSTTSNTGTSVAGATAGNPTGSGTGTSTGSTGTGGTPGGGASNGSGASTSGGTTSGGSGNGTNQGGSGSGGQGGNGGGTSGTAGNPTSGGSGNGTGGTGTQAGNGNGNGNNGGGAGGGGNGHGDGGCRQDRNDPDGNGNGGRDEIGGAGGRGTDQDCNNGSGNDDDGEDDNNGHH